MSHFSPNSNKKSLEFILNSPISAIEEVENENVFFHKKSNIYIWFINSIKLIWT